MPRGSGRARRRAMLLAAALAVLGAVAAPVPVPSVAAATGCGRTWSAAQRLGNLPGGLAEVSGFTASARYPGVAWMIRDSDNPPSVYSFTLDGNQPRWKEFKVRGVSNVDWEDVTYTVGADGRGRLWILENGAETGQKKLYEVLEPDPNGPLSATLAATYRVAYPGAGLDTEAIFAAGGRLAFVSRTNPNRLFQLPSPLSTSAVNRLDEQANLSAHSLITATSTSADEHLLMTVGVDDAVTVFSAPGTPSPAGFGDRAPIFRREVPEVQHEAGDFFPSNSCDIVLVAEDASVWRLSNGGTVVGLADETPTTTTSTSAPPAPAAPPFAAPPPPPPAGTTSAPTEGSGNSGYWLLDRGGAVHAFGRARHFGQPSGTGATPAVDLEPTPGNDGYWILDAPGRVGAYGAALNLGSVPYGRLVPGEEATSLSATPTGEGYWVFTSRGRTFPFGDARFAGDLAGRTLNQPVLDSVPTPSGGGYYMVAADGGVFTFGDAAFLGSTGDLRLNAPVRSLVPDPDGSGYWLVAADGGVFTFGAPFRGSLGGTPLNRPVTGMAPYGDGYVMVGEDGGVFNFSNLAFSGSLGAEGAARPIVAVAPVR